MNFPEDDPRGPCIHTLYENAVEDSLIALTDIVGNEAAVVADRINASLAVLAFAPLFMDVGTDTDEDSDEGEGTNGVVQ